VRLADLDYSTCVGRSCRWSVLLFLSLLALVVVFLIVVLFLFLFVVLVFFLTLSSSLAPLLLFFRPHLRRPLRRPPVSNSPAEASVVFLPMSTRQNRANGATFPSDDGGEGERATTRTVAATENGEEEGEGARHEDEEDEKEGSWSGEENRRGRTAPRSANAHDGRV